MDAFLSCDWGTTSFRLRLVRPSPFAVLASLSSEDGALKVRDRASREGLEAEAAFRSTLESRAAELLPEELLGSREIPRPSCVMISGMASSSIGWRELPYARLPFALDGESVESRSAGEALVCGSKLPVTLLGGLSAPDDVMRGEETEILGIVSTPGREQLGRASLLLLPGTHSKHVRLERGAIVGFATYMTGELFSLLSRESILRHSVAPEAPFDAEAFVRGVVASRDQGGLGALFKTRTNQVLHRSTPGPNTSFLSGVLIGGEVLEACRRGPLDHRIALCANARLCELYGLALETLELGARLIQVPPEEVEEAPARGQAILARRLFTERST